jgi:hypothetical protein
MRIIVAAELVALAPSLQAKVDLVGFLQKCLMFLLSRLDPEPDLENRFK